MIGLSIRRAHRGSTRSTCTAAPLKPQDLSHGDTASFHPGDTGRPGRLPGPGGSGSGPRRARGSPGRGAGAARGPERSGTPGPRPAKTGSDVGSLYPFIRSQAVHGEFPLSFLRDEFRDVATWKPRARGKLLELLHYAPPPCEPNAEVVERVEADGYVREKVLFNTTPDLRIPAYVLIPKGLTKPAPAIVALHDHGGFYFWGKEKVVEVAERASRRSTEFKRRAYSGKSIASELARRGYVVIAIDMFYWGERRMLLDDDPADWRDRPADIPADRVAAFNRRAGQSEPLVGRTIYSAGFTWSGVMFWDDVRTVDYLVTSPRGRSRADRLRRACRSAACDPATWRRSTTGSRPPSSSAGWPPTRPS